MDFKRFLYFLTFAALLYIPCFSEGQGEGGYSVEDWEKYAKLGPYTESAENWTEIETAAKLEKTILVYSLSSRVFDFARTFTKKYGIRVDAADMNTPNIMEKLRLEQNAGIFNADVVLIDDVPLFFKDFVETKMIYKYVPVNLKSVIDKDALNAPLLIHHYGARGILYNTKFNKKEPFDSWWDLTRPEWKKKIIIKDPMRSGVEFNMFATFVQHYSDFEENYKKEFGEDIKLSGTKNAGYEFIKRLMNNELILTADSNAIATDINDAIQNPPVGLISFSKMRVIIDERMNVDFIKNLKPIAAFKTTTVMGIVKKAPHPNAAKLMIKWMAGNDNPKAEDYAGYKPYFVIGNWAVRSDIDEPEDQPSFKTLAHYIEDPEWLYNNSVDVRDFWIQNQ